MRPALHADAAFGDGVAGVEAAEVGAVGISLADALALELVSISGVGRSGRRRGLRRAGWTVSGRSWMTSSTSASKRPLFAGLHGWGCRGETGVETWDPWLEVIARWRGP